MIFHKHFWAYGPKREILTVRQCMKCGRIEVDTPPLGWQFGYKNSKDYLAKTKQEFILASA